MKKFKSGRNKNLSDWDRPGHKSRDYTKYKISNVEVTSETDSRPEFEGDDDKTRGETNDEKASETIENLN